MSLRSSTSTLVLTIALVAAACTQSASPSTTTIASTSSTTSTSTATTTTRTPLTTTTTHVAPLLTVQVLGDIPSEIATAASAFLSSVQDPRNDSSTLQQGLVDRHAAAAGLMNASYTATAMVQELEIGGSVAVLTLDSGDVLLVADDGDGWNVVGADLASQNIDPWFGESPRRVLVLGSDARPGQSPPVFRMDSIHILTSVAETGDGTVLGYPRDSYVETPFGAMRINALTTAGRGPDAIFNQFTQEWGIPLDGYILTAFSGFERLVRATIGRLLITLPMSIPVQEYWPGFSAGEQVLTPTRTLDYSRTRKQVPGGDFTRSLNQGVVMLATLAMLQQGTIEDAPMLIGELVKYTETNLAPSDLIQLAASAFALDLAKASNIVLPGQLGRGAGGASVVLLDDSAEGIVADVIEDGILDSDDG